MICVANVTHCTFKLSIFTTASDVSKIVSRFTAVRSTLPPMVITTPTERDHTPWSTPSPPVFSRLQLLAKESLAVLSAQLEGSREGETDIKVCHD